MDDAPNPRDIGARIERLLDDVHAAVDRRAYAVVEELVRQLTELYGAGLARIVELTRDADPRLVDRFGADELVASLLLVHGLHPVGVEDRVEAALQSVRPFLAHHDGDVELLGIDPDAGAVLLRLLGSCDGCPSSAVTLQLAVERAIVDAAPEIVRIDVDGRRTASSACRPRDARGPDPQAALRLVPDGGRSGRRSRAQRVMSGCRPRRDPPHPGRAPPPASAARRGLRAVRRADRRRPRPPGRSRAPQPVLRLSRLLPPVHRRWRRWAQVSRRTRPLRRVPRHPT